MYKQCKICKKTFRKPYNCSVKEWVNTRKYCSNQCRIEFTKTLRTSKGYLGKNGYIYLSMGTGIKVLQHRYVVEQYIGRKLFNCEHIHHKNGIKTDNRIENLQILSIQEHNKIHYPKGSKFGINSEKRIKSHNIKSG